MTKKNSRKNIKLSQRNKKKIAVVVFSAWFFVCILNLLESDIKMLKLY